MNKEAIIRLLHNALGQVQKKDVPDARIGQKNKVALEISKMLTKLVGASERCVGEERKRCAGTELRKSLMRFF